MLGAIIGDIVGSKYEFNNIKTKDFVFFQPDMFFTDDTVMTVAIYDALSSCKGDYSKLSDLAIQKMQEYGRKDTRSVQKLAMALCLMDGLHLKFLLLTIVLAMEVLCVLVLLLTLQNR